MADEGVDGQIGETGGERDKLPQGADTTPTWPDELGAEAPLALPNQSPLFHAEHANRYERQRLIKAYETKFDCQLIVVIDAIFPDGILLLEELLYNLDPALPLHVILDSPGGDGETAVRMIRAAQARCTDLTIIVPDQAKSAATILALGAHRIIMGPTSDLGPVDPQFNVPNWGLVSAKVIISAVERAEESIRATPETYPLHASLLENVDSLLVETARSAMERTSDLVRDALASNPDRSPEQVVKLATALKDPLIDLPQQHAAVFSADDALNAGLPVERVDPTGEQWKSSGASTPGTRPPLLFPLAQWFGSTRGISRPGCKRPISPPTRPGQHHLTAHVFVGSGHGGTIGLHQANSRPSSINPFLDQPERQADAQHASLRGSPKCSANRGPRRSTRLDSWRVPATTSRLTAKGAKFFGSS